MVVRYGSCTLHAEISNILYSNILDAESLRSSKNVEEFIAQLAARQYWYKADGDNVKNACCLQKTPTREIQRHWWQK